MICTSMLDYVLPIKDTVDDLRNPLNVTLTMPLISHTHSTFQCQVIKQALYTLSEGMSYPKTSRVLVNILTRFVGRTFLHLVTRVNGRVNSMINSIAAIHRCDFSFTIEINCRSVVLKLIPQPSLKSHLWAFQQTLTESSIHNTLICLPPGKYIQLGAVITRSIFSKIFFERHPIARPLLWLQPLIDNLPLFLKWCGQYHVIIYMMSAIDCTCFYNDPKL